MKALAAVLVAGVLTVAGRGTDEDSPETTSAAPEQATTEAAPRTGAAPETGAEPKPSGTTITVRESEFGRMLVDSSKQAIYIFENDSEGRTVCYDECAEAWPPVERRAVVGGRAGRQAAPIAPPARSRA